MTYLGTSQASVSVALASVTLLTTGSLLGASSGPVSMTAAAVTLTTTGGPLGSSVGAGGLDCAALDLDMLCNMGASTGAGEIESTVDRRLAEYATIVEAVVGDFATVVMDWTNYDGLAFGMTFDGASWNPSLEPAGQAPSIVYAFNGWTGSPTSAVLYTFTYDNRLDGRVFDEGTGPTVGISSVFTQGITPVDAVLGLVQAASDGFVIDAPLWPGIQEVTFATGTGTGILRGTEKAMSLWEVGREVYSLWGYEIADLRLITYGRESIVNWCNAAMQLIYSNAHRLDYFNREVLELTVTTSGTVALPANVQLVQGPARIGTAVLSTLASRAEYDHFAALYVGDSSLASPIAFYVEPLRGTGSDSVGLTLNLAPLPAGTVTVRLDVTLEPPRYDVVDLMQATILQLPHKWAETIFLPIVRKWACADSRMGNTRRQAVMPQIDEQFAAAKQMLGLADIEPPAQSKTKPEKQGGAA